MKFVILTGMSGAGKSTALKMMEDIGFYCVDNLPIPLLEKFVELSEIQNGELQKVALGIDARSGQALEELREVLERIEAKGEDFSLLHRKIMNSRASTEGGFSVVYKFSDKQGTKYLIHKVTDLNGFILHRDFDAVRIASGQLINKRH